MLQQDTVMKSVSSEESETLKESTDNNVHEVCVPEPDLPASTEVSYSDKDSQLIEAKASSNQNDLNDEDKPIEDDVNSNMNGDINDSSQLTCDNNDVDSGEAENDSESHECGITSNHSSENNDESIEVVASDVQCETNVSTEEICEEHFTPDDDLPLANIEGSCTEEMVRDNLDYPLSSNVDSVQTETKDLSLGSVDTETKDLSVPCSSSECPPSKPLNICDNENKLDINSENSYVPSPRQSSWGGTIRSVSARRPVRKPSVPPENMSERHSRSSTPCKVGISVYNVHSDDSAQVSENLFSSLKRKAFEMDCTVMSKRPKINGSQNSTFFSMVSSPLRLLKSKISDRIIESSKVNEEGNIKSRNEEEHEECKIDKGSQIKDQNVLTSDDSNVNSSLTKSWCTVM